MMVMVLAVRSLQLGHGNERTNRLLSIRLEAPVVSLCDVKGTRGRVISCGSVHVRK
jgi:hypothetical protein